MQKSFFLVSVVLLLFSCGNTRSQQDLNEFDSLLLIKQNIPPEIINHAKNNLFQWTQKIHNRLYCNIIQDGNQTYCITKEYFIDSMYSYFSRFEDAAYYNFLPAAYDSSQYDNNVHEYNKKSLTEKKKYSANLNNLPKLRRESVNYQQNLHKCKDIEELQALANKIQLLKNFSFANIIQVRILKRLLVLTQIQCTEHFTNQRLESLNSYIFGRYIEEITGQQSIANLKLRGGIQFNKIGSNYKPSFKTILTEIKSNDNNQQTYYFYDYTNGVKLFRFSVRIEDGKIYLQKKYINAENQKRFFEIP